MVEQRFVGTPFRQWSHRLRIQQPGKPDRISERPRRGNRDKGWGDFLDSDEHPTLVTFEPGDQVDVAFLIKTGAISPYTPPQPAKGEAAEQVEEVGESGEV